VQQQALLSTERHTTTKTTTTTLLLLLLLLLLLQLLLLQQLQLLYKPYYNSLHTHYVCGLPRAPRLAVLVLRCQRGPAAMICRGGRYEWTGGKWKRRRRRRCCCRRQLNAPARSHTH